MFTTYVRRVAIFLLSCSLAACAHSQAFTNKPDCPVPTSGPADSSPYRIMTLLSWETVNAQGKLVTMEARLEELKESEAIKDRTRASGRLSIRNLDTGRTIYEKEDSIPLSLDGADDLTVVWGGGSANRVEIIRVTAEIAEVILSESFRLGVGQLVMSRDGDINWFIATAEGGAAPIYTTRYIEKNGRYQAAGKVSLEKFSATIDKLFKP